jgi:hypothetical protein
MKIKLESITSDTTAEREGAWIPINEWPGLKPDKPWEMTPTPGLEFYVKSINDPSYKLALQKHAEAMEQEKVKYPDGIVPFDIRDAGEGKLIAENLLLGWKGFDETYSKDVAAKLLPRPAAKPIRDMITFCASKVGKRQIEFIEEAVKNSGKQQSGS